MGVATAAFWVAAWAVTFTLPYLYNDESGSAGLGPMVGFIYAGGTLIALAFVCEFRLLPSPLPDLPLPRAER